MPTYEYRCRTCDEVFEQRRAMADADEPTTCTAGHADAVRLLSVFASVSATGDGPSAGAAPGPCGGSGACSPG